MERSFFLNRDRQRAARSTLLLAPQRATTPSGLDHV